MRNNNSLHGLRKRDTYNSLVGYLDGGQETIKYPNRLATQLKNSHQMSNLLDDEGRGWFEENIEQQRRFTEQQVQDVVMKEGLEEGQTFQEQKILQIHEAMLKREQEKKKHDEDIEQERRADAQEHRDIEVAKMKAATEAQKKKEEEAGIVHQFKQNVKSKLAQEAASYLIQKGIEKLPELLARVV
jgi:membrane protein involved in colicin uptake